MYRFHVLANWCYQCYLATIPFGGIYGSFTQILNRTCKGNGSGIVLMSMHRKRYRYSSDCSVKTFTWYHASQFVLVPVQVPFNLCLNEPLGWWFQVVCGPKHFYNLWENCYSLNGFRGLRDYFSNDWLCKICFWVIYCSWVSDAS